MRVNKTSVKAYNNVFILTIVANLITSIFLIVLGFKISDLKSELKGTQSNLAEEKQTSSIYYNEAIVNHQLYEGAIDELNKSKQNLAELHAKVVDTQAKLDAAAAREAGWQKEVASRSRRAGTVSSVERSSAPEKVSGGPLHDITMYCPTGNTTASGKVPQRGMVATIRRDIPFRTRILIDGLGTFVVEDRIGHSSEFDIFTPSCSEAERFGREHRAVTILD